MEKVGLWIALCVAVVGSLCCGAEVIKPQTITCLNKGKCFLKKLQCPAECPERKPSNPSSKACYSDCGPKCETSCKGRVRGCNGFGAICYDPRFIGGDGTMFYFHGAKNEDFTLVSDTHLHINAHFIGTRPATRPRDFTWVQALSIRYASQVLTVSATRSSSWADSADHLTLTLGETSVPLAQGHLATWTSPGGDFNVERTAQTNALTVHVGEVAEISFKAVPITKKDDRVHSYNLPKDDCFVHLDLHFNFFDLSPQVTGVLGQTYRPDFVSPVKKGVPMPIMGGEDKFKTSSLLATDCKHCTIFKEESMASASGMMIKMPSSDCTGSFGGSGGLVCKR